MGDGQLIDVNAVAALNGDEVCNALLGMHAFTACDSTTAFSGKGKLPALKLLKKYALYREAFTFLGNEWVLSRDVYDILEQFTCELYGKKNLSSVNFARYLEFIDKEGDMDTQQVPPLL